jgi:hypothetical protein
MAIDRPEAIDDAAVRPAAQRRMAAGRLCRAATVLAVLAAAWETSPDNVTVILTGAIPDGTGRRARQFVP